MGDPMVDAEENQPTPLETATGINQIDYPEPTYTAPAPGPVYYDYSSDNSDDSGQSDSQSGADSAQEDDSAGYGGY